MGKFFHFGPPKNCYFKPSSEARIPNLNKTFPFSNISNGILSATHWPMGSFYCIIHPSIYAFFPPLTHTPYTWNFQKCVFSEKVCPCNGEYRKYKTSLSPTSHTIKSPYPFSHFFHVWFWQISFSRNLLIHPTLWCLLQIGLVIQPVHYIPHR